MDLVRHRPLGAIQIWRFVPLAAVLVVVARAGTLPAGAQPCNTEDGNIAYSVNYNAVAYGEITVCNQAENIDPEAVLHAIDAWNNMIGKSLFTTGCPPYTGIVIVDVEEGGCGEGVACTSYPTQESPVFLQIGVTPTLKGYPLDSQKHVAVHEIGHNLGFAHWPACDAVMDGTTCGYKFLQPTSVDADNYEKAYWVEAVTNLTGSSPSPGAVSLTWSPVNSAGEELCNEKDFAVFRWNRSTGWYDIYVASGPKDSSGVGFAGQPQGGQCYAVWSMTDARAFSFAGYRVTPVSVRPGGPCGNADSDGDVDAVDALFGLKYVVGSAQGGNTCLPGSPLVCLPHSDVTGDGSVDAVDVLFILQHVVGLRPQLCVCPTS